jgi:hypothetical protein
MNTFDEVNGSKLTSERVKGIEPSCPAWEAGVLPLNYTRGGMFDVRRLMFDLQAAIRLFAILQDSITSLLHRLSPLRHLFGERTLRAIGIVLQTEVFINLQQPLLTRDRL